ncbi:hypothetical protein HHK36_026167 [Tetracentron sinense]|uniref:Senataxin n=1 Tax=Tetracentron sinense TaxID=13715 RepID=A0A834YJF9_TETSI|nr:hypothetical protein HHK36_026167 [Tetracentron sinense]
MTPLGPSLVHSLRDSSLHSSLRQPAFDLMQTIIVSDAAALITLILKCRASPIFDSSMSADINDDDDDDELLFSHDVEEKDISCWSEFSSQSKLASRECRAWMCIPMLWFDVLLEVNPSVLPISFSKAVLWALSRFSMVEPENSTEMALSIRDWLSSYAGKISASFGWEVPTGSDDGGDGRESKNSINASTMCIPLIKMFRRLTAHFVIQVEQGELRKQWTWEPRMGESLILLLLDPNDNVRQVDRLILEQVSNTRGLACGLQFLCSCASSLSAIYLGLRHALKLTSPGKPVDDSNLLKFSSQGGFLLQPVFDSSPLAIRRHPSNVVGIKSWEKFNSLLSEILWPSIRKCLVEGKAYMDNKISQGDLPVELSRLMTCVRLLEILPVVFERLSSSFLKLSGNSGIMVQDLFDFKWLHDLMDWGKSSLVVITRYWKQAVISLLDLLKVACHDNSAWTIREIEKLFSSDTVAMDELKEQVSRLSVSLSSEAEYAVEKTTVKLEPSTFKGFSFERKYSASDTEPSSTEDADKSILLDDHGRKSSAAISTSKNLLEAFQLRETSGNDGLASRKPDSNASRGKLEPRSLIKLKGANEKRKESNYIYNVSNACTSEYTANIKNSSDGTVCSKILDKSCTNMVSETRDTVIKELICNTEDDPWELALKSSRRPQSSLTKTSASVPKRQVIQLKLPLENKSGYLNRLDAGVRRLTPPRLDDWYRPILEIDYFSTVGLSSVNNDENPTMSKLKEVPVCFQSHDHYVDIFRPLVLEEFKAQLHSSFVDASSSDDICCGSLFVLSVEKIDDFHLVRGVPDESESTASRGCSENDLIMLTKHPLQNSSHDVHMVGKVERREKDNKRRSNILVIRFYLQNGSSRLNRARRLLLERSKWYLSRIMSIIPQLREFQALSSLKDIPILPIILKPTNHSLDYNKSIKVELGKLSQPMQRILESSFNNSQLQAISVAIGPLDSAKDFQLSLIQGPPGTGKTRTIVAIVSGLLALSLQRKNDTTKLPNSSLKPSSISCTNPRPQFSQSAAIARAWQDAGFARQLNEDAQKNSKSTESSARGRVLICAQSNAAVDELVSRISNEGLYGSDGKMYKPYLVRVGNAKTVHPNSLPFFIDTLVDQRLTEERMNESVTKNELSADSSAHRSNLERLVDRIRFYEAKRANLRDGKLDLKISSEDGTPKEDDGEEMSGAAIGAKLRKLYDQKKEISMDLNAAQAREKKSFEEIKALKHKLRKSILREAEIVVTTLSGCGGDLYGVCSESISSYKFGNSSEHTLFDAVVIDEAAQALEPATLIPLQLLKSNGTKCIMVGDPKQLPATVLSNVASKFLYQCSMFERLQRAGHPVIMLTEQYRMHPEICQFPSLHFYDKKLLNGNQMASKSAPFHETGYLGPYVFFDIIDGQERHGKNSGAISLYNECEADAAVELLRFFKNRYPSEFVRGRIGIITPYRSQVSLLRSRFSSAFGPNVTADMEINTVDGFQGREVDILILSTVRASDPNSTEPGINSSSIGFVADVRRMNVALTRAKLSLWILGNASTLQTNQNWSALFKDAKKRNLVISVTRPYECMFKKPFSAFSEKPISGSSDSRSKNMKEKTGNTSRDTDDGNVSSVNRDLLFNVPNKDNRSLKDVKSTRKGKHVADGQSKGKVRDQKQVNLGSTVHSGKEKRMHEKSRSESNPAHSRETNVADKNLKLQMLRGTEESSEHNTSQKKLGILIPSTEGSYQEKEANEGCGAPNLADTPKDLIATRKRQRDAVDALLSSALISSKKPETSSKSASVKRPHSPTLTARGASKPSKPRKGKLLCRSCSLYYDKSENQISWPLSCDDYRTGAYSSASSTSLLQDRAAVSARPQINQPQSTTDRSLSSQDLVETSKSLKDLVQDPYCTVTCTLEVKPESVTMYPSSCDLTFPYARLEDTANPTPIKSCYVPKALTPLDANLGFNTFGCSIWLQCLSLAFNAFLIMTGHVPSRGNECGCFSSLPIPVRYGLLPRLIAREKALRMNFSSVSLKA